MTRYTDQELIEDLQRVAGKFNEPLRWEDYHRLGKMGAGTVEERFGGWNKAKEAAGLEIGRNTVIKYSSQDLLDALGKVAERIEQPVPRDKEAVSEVFQQFEDVPCFRTYIINWDYGTLWDLLDRYRIIHSKADVFRQVAEQIREWPNGFYRYPDLQQVFQNVSQYNSQAWMTEFVEWVNKNRDDITITGNNGGGNGKRYYIDTGTSRKEQVKENVPEQYHHIIDYGTGHGRSPSGIAAAITYLTTDLTQVEAAKKHGVTGVTLRNCRDFLNEHRMMPEELRRGEAQ